MGGWRGWLVAAAALLAGLAGAQLAAATTLCKAEEKECAAGNRLPAGTTVKANLSAFPAAQLVTNLGALSCPESTLEFKTSAESGAPLPATVTAFTVSKCAFKGVACTPTITALGTASIQELFAVGFLTMKGTTMNLKCGMVCNFENLPVAQVLEAAGFPDLLWAEKAKPVRSGGFCPETAEWTAEYEVTAPAPLYVSALP